ncbi:hypothetical protein RU99_GL002473 [Enterococcus casseliflavus]|nr:hypothetical protein RU99_GL002473 [Enterococcus casseliflavus]
MINQYEQGYLSYSDFINEFPDSISESQECLFGAKCIEFYVAVALRKMDCHYYIQRYGGDFYGVVERNCIKDTSIEDEQDPFIAFLP